MVPRGSYSGHKSKRAKRSKSSMGKAKKREPLLLTDGSIESSKAALSLIEAHLPFSLVPSEDPGPVLISSERTFCGLEGVERYIGEKKKVKT